MITNYSILTNKTIRINACYDYSTVAEVPNTINSMPVTEIAPYAFSANKEVSSNGLLWYSSQTDQISEPPRICGSTLKEIYLPKSIKKIGRYAFYGCDELHTVHMCSSTLDLGNGIFMGCSNVKNIHMLVDENSRSSLPELLLMFCQPICLNYYTETEDYGIKLKYLLIFPSYFENNEENTPARITFRDLHGSGLYYRNCFANTAFQVDRYDSLFAYAVANEEEDITMSLALSRLIYDTGLKENDRREYCDYITEHISRLSYSVRSFFDAEILSYDRLKQFLHSDFITEDLISIIIDDFGKMKLSALLSLSMDIKKNRFAEKSNESVRKRRRFEL